jgi:hypothetical protein
MVADKFIVRADDMCLIDVQIRARLVDAVIKNDAIIESLCDEFSSESTGGSFAAGLGFLGLTEGIRTLKTEVQSASNTPSCWRNEH